MHHELKFAEWYHQNEGILSGLNKGIDWVQQVAGAIPSLAADIFQAQRDIKNHQSVDKIGFMEVMRSLSKLNPSALEAEGQALTKVDMRDAAKVIIMWQQSQLNQFVTLLVRLGEVLHINPIIKAMPHQFGNVWEKFKQVNTEQDITKKAAAIVPLVWAITQLLHLLVSSALISGVMAKIALLLSYFQLGAMLGAGAYLGWGLLIFLGILHKKTKSGVLHWLIAFIMNLISPTHRQEHFRLA